MSVHGCSVAASGVVGAYPSGVRAFASARVSADWYLWWVTGEEVYVVGFGVELDQVRVEALADMADGGLAAGEHGVVEHLSVVVGHNAGRA